MNRWMTGAITGILCAFFAYGDIATVDARSTLPSVCVQAKRSYLASKKYTRSTIGTLNKFKRNVKKAFRAKLQSKKFYLRAWSKYTLSTTKYNATKSYLSSKGFAISRTSNLAKVLKSKGFLLRGKSWSKAMKGMAGKVKSWGYRGKKKKKKKAAPKTSYKKAPIDFRRIKQTRRAVVFSKNRLTLALKKTRYALRLLIALKKSGLAAKKRAATAKAKLAATKRLLRRCGLALKAQQLYQKNRKKRRTSIDGKSRYCGANHSTKGYQAFRVYCAPCDPMRSSCENTCFGFNFGQMEASTQSQEGQLNSAEQSSTGGNVFFEIDMKTTEARTEETNETSGITDTSGQAGSLD